MRNQRMTAVAMVDDVVDNGADWLASDEGTGTGLFQLRTGHNLRIAPLSESDVLNARHRARRDSINLSRYRRELIAASVNKAYECTPSDRGYLNPQQLSERPVGELASILSAILRLSGLNEDDDARYIQDLLF